MLQIKVERETDGGWGVLSIFTMAAYTILWFSLSYFIQQIMYKT